MTAQLKIREHEEHIWFWHYFLGNKSLKSVHKSKVLLKMQFLTASSHLKRTEKESDIRNDKKGDIYIR